MHQLVSPGLRGLVVRGSSPEDLLTVLIGSGKEEGITSLLAVPASQNVGRDFRVGMADVRSVIYIENRGRNKKRFTRWAHTGHVYKLNGANLKACS